MCEEELEAAYRDLASEFNNAEYDAERKRARASLADETRNP